MRKTDRIKKLLLGLVALGLLNANIAARTPYDDWKEGKDPVPYYNPGNEGGGGSGTEGGGSGNEGGGQSGGTENPGGASGGSGGGGQQTGVTPPNNQDDEDPDDGEGNDGEDTENPNDDGKEKEEDDSERRYREAVRALQESEELLRRYDSLYNVEKAKFYNEHRDEIRMALDLKAAAEATLKAKALVDSLPKSTVGDPVFITNGSFWIDDIDESFVYGISQFNLTRKLSSGEFPAGSFGKNWFTSLDSRVIWGKSDLGLEERKAMYEDISQKVGSLSRTMEDGGMNPNSIPTMVVLKGLCKNLELEIKVIEDNLNRVQEKNRYVEYAMEAIAEKLPADYFILIDDDGSTKTFQYDSKDERYQLCGGKDVWAEENENGLEVHFLDGSVKAFDRFGQISKIKNRYGSGIQFDYNEPCNERRTVKSISHLGRKMLGFEWNEANEISSVYNPQTGKQRFYEYNYRGNLVKMTYENKTYRFAYDDSDDIVKIIKPDSSFIQISYYLEGDGGKKRVESVRDESGAAEKFMGDYEEGKMTYVDADGNRYQYEFEGSNITMQEMEDGSTARRTYSEDGRVISKSDEYGTIDYEYDQYGNMVKASYSDGSCEEWSYGQPFNLLCSYVDRDGIETLYEYDSLGSPVRITRDGVCLQEYECNALGQVIYAKGMYADDRYSYDAVTYRLVSDKGGSYKWDSSGRISSYTTRDGRTWKYSYSADGNKVIVISPDKLKSVYEYNNREDLVCVTETDLNDGSTRLFDYEYDKRHLLVKVSSGYGKGEDEAKSNLRVEAGYEYTLGGKIKSLILWNRGDAVEFDGKGIKSEMSYDGDMIRSIESSFVDSYGNQLGEKHRSNYSYSFVEGKLKVQLADENGKINYAIYDREGNVVESGGVNGWSLKNDYSPAGRLLQQKNISGGMLRYDYDRITGNVSSVQMGDARTASYEYDALGRLVHSVTQNGFIQDYEYEENGSSINVKVKSNRGQNEIYSDIYGRIQTSKLSDQNDEVILEQKVEYKDDGSVEIQRGEERQRIRLNAWGETLEDDGGKSYSYDQNGKCVRIESIDLPINIYYNAFGKVSRIVQGKRFQNYRYNAKGNLVKVEDVLGVAALYEYDATGENLIHAEERGMPDKRYEYDDDYRLKKYYEGGELVMTYSYDKANGLTSFTDAMGKTFVQKTDGYGRLIEERNRSGKVKILEYDDEKGEMKVRDFNGDSYTVIQSGPLNACMIQYQDGRTEKTFFNAAGSIIRAESNGVSEKFNYNKAQRLEEFSFRDKSGHNEYDDRGRRIWLEAGEEKVKYDYDEKNRVIGVSGLDYHTEIFYDEFGNEKEILDSSGSKTEFQYDEAGRLTCTKGYDGYGVLAFMEALVYGEDGRVSCSINEEGFIKVFEYDGRGRVKKVQIPYKQEMEESFADQLKECGKVPEKYVPRKIQLSPELKSKCVDLMEKCGLSRMRLDLDKSVWTEEYEYDARGNRIKCSAPTGILEYEYDDDNRLTEIKGESPVAFRYDANGNLLERDSSRGKKKWTYGGNKRPLSFESENEGGSRVRIDYQYDALGRRVVDGRTASLYDGLGMNPLHEWQLNEVGYERSFAETDGANAVRFRSLGEGGNSGDDVCGFDRTYIYANGRLLGQRNRNYAYSLGIEDSRYGYMQDMRNSIGAVTDGKGNKISSVSYDLNGKMYSYDRRRQAQENAASLGLDHGFVGKKYDAMTSSYNFGYRDYSPTTASFTSEDPIRDGLNWYSYCAGDPVNFVDLWGLENNSIYRMGMPSEYWNVNPDKEKTFEYYEYELNKEFNYLLSTVLRDCLGADYSHDRMPTESKMDCSGMMVYAIDKMGFEVPKYLTAMEMSSGKIDWIMLYDDVKEERQGLEGVLNFYEFGVDGIDHVNYGVGMRGEEEENQIMDASYELTWQEGRNKSDRQLKKAEANKINQTYAPFSTRTAPEKQGYIDIHKLHIKQKTK